MALVQMSSVEEAIEALIVSSGDHSSLAAAATCKKLITTHVFPFLTVSWLTNIYVWFYNNIFMCFYLHLLCTCGLCEVLSRVKVAVCTPAVCMNSFLWHMCVWAIHLKHVACMWLSWLRRRYCVTCMWLGCLRRLCGVTCMWLSCLLRLYRLGCVVFAVWHAGVRQCDWAAQVQRSAYRIGKWMDS